jgi:hypothetical protein
LAGTLFSAGRPNGIELNQGRAAMMGILALTWSTNNPKPRPHMITPWISIDFNKGHNAVVVVLLVRCLVDRSFSARSFCCDEGIRYMHVIYRKVETRQIANTAFEKGKIALDS